MGTEFGELKGNAVIIPKAAGRETEILLFSKYYSDLLVRHSSGFEDRLKALFEVKPKWTFGEIETYLGDWVEPDQKINVLLSRLARAVKEDLSLIHI